VKIRPRILIYALLCTLLFHTKVFAVTSPVTGIVLDGSFTDWENKPLVRDPKNDSNSPYNDFQQVRYIADKDYLYLYVERLAANKSEPWHFNVIILNAVKGQNNVQVPSGATKSINGEVFDITTHYAENKSGTQAFVTVSFNGRDLESTLSVSNNAKEIEIRIPLDQVGLDGFNKEVKFVLRSEGNSEGEIDWLPDRDYILVATGSTGWKLSTAVMFIFASVVVYKMYGASIRN
jgi:hypothetical protein